MTYYVIRTDGGDGALMAFDTQEAASKYAWQNWYAAPDDVQLARFADPRFVFCVATGERYRHGDMLRFKVVEDVKAIAHKDWAKAVLFEVGQDADVDYRHRMEDDGRAWTRSGCVAVAMDAVYDYAQEHFDGMFDENELLLLSDECVGL